MKPGPRGPTLEGMKSSIGSRSLKLLGLAAKVGREEIAQKMKEQITRGIDEVTSGRVKARIEQARLIADNLSQLKGAAMKAGQMLSLDASDYFPPEAVEILSKLQGKADPVEFELLRRVLIEDLGEERVRQFQDLDPNAAASASIGQVHRARLETESGLQNVAIKIQYPGVSDSIDSDLRILKTLAQSLLRVTGRKIDLDELFEELSIVLKQEADYGLEKSNMLDYGALVSSLPEFKVPSPIASHCSRRVLTMTWQPGLSIQDWLKTSPSYAQRERLGQMVLDLYCKEFYEWGLVQTDPNYANFLIEPEPLTLTLLDFGATLRYPVEFREQYIEMLKTLGSLDRAKIVRSFVEFGLISDRESDESKDLFAEFLMLSVEPFQPHRQPFRFKDEDYAKRSRELGQKFTQSLKYSPPPRKILFLHRKLGGIFTLLKKLDVQLELTPYWEKMVGTQFRA